MNISGMDLNCGTTVLNHAQAALDKGLIWEELINMHLRNLFAVRMRLGMFDGDPGTLPFGSLGPSDVCTNDHQNLALEAAQQSIVLLKNDRSTLPWKKIKRFKLAVIGPHGNSTQEMLGNYEGIPCKFISPLDGITALFGVDGENVIYAPGCADASCEDGSLIQSAATAASEADAVVLFVGLSQAQESEGRDRESLLLPGMQQELISTVVDAVSGRPIVVVILSGGPVDVSFMKEDDRVGSILWAGYPGQAGGQAIAEVIFGDVNPGKLVSSVSSPRMWSWIEICLKEIAIIERNIWIEGFDWCHVVTAGRLALSWYHENYTQMDMSNMQMRPDLSLGYPGRTHRFFTGSPIWEFGDGLSYSQFSHVIVEAPSTITAPTLHQQLCHMDASNSLMAMECLTEDTGQRMKFCYWLCIDLRFWGQLLDSCYED
jgi:beta-D-xylosidase 4